MLNTIQYPTVDEIESALFIQPHPDDNEIGAGGLMAKLVERNIPVYSITVTQGDGGSNTHTPQELVALRHQEAQHASDILGVTYLGNLGFNNSNPGTVEAICEKLVAIIRKIKPHAIFSVDPTLPNEIHPVHLRVGRAVMEAFLRCDQAYYPFHTQEKEEPFSVSILGQYFTHRPNTIVDITPVIELKKASIRAHQSQVNETFLNSILFLDRYQGYKHNLEYAECFKLLRSIHTHCFTLDEDDLKTITHLDIKL